jgi:hypothetical protein
MSPSIQSATRSIARISHSFRRETQREPCSGSRSAAETDSSKGAARQGAACINEGADFGCGLCEYTLPTAKIKPDAANAWLRQVAAGNCEKSGLALVFAFLVLGQPTHAAADLRPVPLQSSITQVQPMTGIVLWSTNSQRRSAPIQLEFAYLGYDQVVNAEGHYDWAQVETLLNDVASRGHQTILRWHDTYVGKPTRVPDHIKALSDYQETLALSEKKETGFPDWSHPELKRFILDFYTRFAERYDQDPRLAFVQTGFGLWAEYHIYDGPMELGKTFPDKAFQAEF